MTINTSIASSTTMSMPPPSAFVPLFVQSDLRQRASLSQADKDALVDAALNIALLPIIKTTGQVPTPLPWNWDSASHYTAWKVYDFGLKNKLCVRIDIV